MGHVPHQFQLQAFASETVSGDLQLSGSLTRSAGALFITYMVEGDLESIRWPQPSLASERCHGLWQNTCFEFFISVKGSSAYWEGNLSPNGFWNVYRFTAYREGMQEELAVGHLWPLAERNQRIFNLSCRLETLGIVEDNLAIEIGVSSVLQSGSGEISYWALSHPGSKPDFHDRQSFILESPAVAR